MPILTDAPPDSGGFGLLARALPDAVLALDAEGVVVFADARAAGLFGDALPGVRFDELLAPDDRGAIRDAAGGLAVGAWDVRPAVGGPWLSVALHAIDPSDASLSERGGGAVVLARPVPTDEASDRTDLLRLAFDAANNLLVVTDARAPDAPIVMANEYFLEATGYAREEVVGRNCRFLQTRADGTRDDDQPGLVELRRALAAGEPTRVVLRNYRKSGELFYNELYVSPIHDASGDLVHFVGVQNDVTERVLAEQVSAERAEMVGSFFEGMPLPMGVLEQRDGHLLHRAVNQAAATLLGHPVAEIVGAEIAALDVPAQERERWAAAVRQAADGPATFETAHPWGSTDPDASAIQFTVSPVPASAGLFAYVGQDVTVARRTERERTLLSAAVASAAEAIVVTDADLVDGPHILYANAAHLHIFGYEADDIVGKTPRIYQGPRTERAVLDRVRAGLEAGEMVRAETINYRKDGTPFHLEWEIAPVHGPDGRVVNFVGTQRDVTERRWLEREVLDVSAHERERMARDLHDGLGQVLTGAALRIEALANGLDAQGLGDRAQEAREGRALVERALNEARATARGLLPVVADRNGLTVALGRLASDVGQAYGIPCSFRAPEPVGARTVEAAGHLLRIAQEAVANAARHGRPDTIEIALHASEGTATLTVRDDGTGISQGGAVVSGLGLHTMRYRADRVDGTLRIGPRPEGGTEVVVSFPTDPR
ncbi:PAS domain-containing protein [Rubrivirga sp. IMCC43871]|uniref:sensor histidine kinase n=1 Tax=Rubrivirga sp. IMCC43871 TaxID=3391575 RepID=UPI00398F9480